MTLGSHLVRGWIVEVWGEVVGGMGQCQWNWCGVWDQHLYFFSCSQWIRSLWRVEGMGCILGGAEVVCQVRREVM